MSRIIGLTYERIANYDRLGLVQPEIQKARGRGSRRLFSRDNLFELAVVKKLLDNGLSLHKIRKSLKEAGKSFPAVKRPLRDLTFRSDGVHIYIDDPQSGAPVDMLHPEQAVIGDALVGVARQIDRAILQFENHRIEPLPLRGKTYLLEIVNDTESQGIIARCPELLGISTKGRTLEEAVDKIKERILQVISRLSENTKNAQ